MTREERKVNPWNLKGVNGEFDCDICGKAYSSLKNLVRFLFRFLSMLRCASPAKFLRLAVPLLSCSLHTIITSMWITM